MSLQSMVQHRIGAYAPARLRRTAVSLPERTSPAVATELLPGASMRVLEATVALAAMATAILIGVR